MTTGVSSWDRTEDTDGATGGKEVTKQKPRGWKDLTEAVYIIMTGVVSQELFSAFFYIYLHLKKKNPLQPQ